MTGAGLAADGNPMPLMDLPKNWHDHSTGEGYQFSFSCDRCHRQYKSTFVRSKADRMGDVAGFLGRHVVGGALGYAMTDAGGRARSSGAQSKEKDAALQNSFAEVKRYFGKCPRDAAWVCTDCWNQQANLCIHCAPRLGVEMASAVAQVQVAQMRQAVANSQQFTGPVGAQQALCPQCHQPASGRFCNGCGAMLASPACPTCGANNAPNARFCGGCGGKLG